MIDPAVEAAQRAIPWHRTVEPYRPLLAAAAREMAKPIRELHKPIWDNCINACCSGEQCRNRYRICAECEVGWPCATAPLIYTNEELTCYEPPIEQIKALRERTGGPLLEIRDALRRSAGDEELAIEMLRLTRAGE